MSTSLDKEWYRKLAPLSIEVLRYLKSDLHKLQEQKQGFLSGAIDIPVFDYTHIEIEQVLQKVHGLRELRAQILAQEEDAIVALLYTAKIDEYLANAALLQSSYEASVSPEQASGAMLRFEEANLYLYGEIDAQLFDLTLRTLKRKLSRVPEEVAFRHQKEYDLLLKLTEKVQEQKTSYRFVIEKKNGLDTTVMRDIVKITDLFQNALLERGLADTWKVEVDTTNLLHTFSVINHERVIAIPGQRFFAEHQLGFTVARLRGLIAHEIDTHIMRRHNGKRSLLRLLAAGLDRYHRGEEGIATFRAQREKGSRSFAGFLGYLSLGLARGMEQGGKRKQFAELYAYLVAYFLVIGQFGAQEAQQRAWHACWRVFRGTTCTSKGVVFMRDATYRAGNVLIHQMLHAYPDAEKDFDIGNFDPTNKSHVSALLKLGLLPEHPWKEIAETFAF